MKNLNRKSLCCLLCIVFLSFNCNKKNKYFTEKTQVQKKLKNKNNLEGKYILAYCENSRFSIEIKNFQKKLNFIIFDRKKIISQGRVNLNKTNQQVQISLGKIEGIYYGDSIVIQNYGNSMNRYNHFTQCDQKYLTLMKIK